MRRGLAEMLRTVSPPELPSEAVIAAAELIDEHGFVALWRTIESRVEEAAQWQWAVRTGEMLIGRSEDRPDTVGALVLGAVTTTLLAAEDHGVRNLRADLWDELGHSDGPSGTRALLAGLATAWRNGTSLPEAAVTRLYAVLEEGRPADTEPHRPGRRGALVALEATVESPLTCPLPPVGSVARWRVHGMSSAPNAISWLERSFDRSRPGVSALSDEPVTALQAFTHAADAARGASEESRQGLLHWIAPRSSAAASTPSPRWRVANGHRSIRQAWKNWSRWDWSIDDEDGHCLAALGDRHAPRRRFARRAHADRRGGVGAAALWARRCGLHAIVPPLPVVRAEPRLACGFHDKAIEKLAAAAEIVNDSLDRARDRIALDRGLLGIERFLRDDRRSPASLHIKRRPRPRRGPVPGSSSRPTTARSRRSSTTTGMRTDSTPTSARGARGRAREFRQR